MRWFSNHTSRPCVSGLQQHPLVLDGLQLEVPSLMVHLQRFRYFGFNLRFPPLIVHLWRFRHFGLSWVVPVLKLDFDLQCRVKVVLRYPASFLGSHPALAHRQGFPLEGHCMTASEISCFFAGSRPPRLLYRICQTACRHTFRDYTACVFLANMSWTNTGCPTCSGG